MTNDETISEHLRNAHTIALVGLTDNPNSPSYQVASYIQSQGYKFYPVNPTIQGALGQNAVDTLADIDGSVDIVDVLTNQVPLDELGLDAAQKGAKLIWLQPGVAPDGAPAQLHGIPVIHNRCIMSDHRRLLAHAQL